LSLEREIMSMFPHTITLYNVETIPKDDYKDEVINHITILRGVLVDDSKAANMRESGLVSADAVNLLIPFNAKATDAVTGAGKKFMPPIEFWRSEDKASHWTLAISAKGAKLDGYTFFVKGVALPPDVNPQTGQPLKPSLVRDVVESMYDDVYNITKIDTKDFGGLQHWEIGGL